MSVGGERSPREAFSSSSGAKGCKVSAVGLSKQELPRTAYGTKLNATLDTRSARYMQICTADTVQCAYSCTATAAEVFIFSAACVISIALLRKKREKEKSIQVAEDFGVVAHAYSDASRIRYCVKERRHAGGEDGGTVWCLAAREALISF